MKLSRQTIEILKHCAKINDGLVIRPIGKEPDRIVPPPGSIRTISRSKAILFEASVPEVFPPDTVIYSLRSMLNELDEQTEIDLQYPDRIELKNGRSVTKFPRVGANLVMTPPSKPMKIIQFEEKAFLHIDDLEEMPLSKRAIWRTATTKKPKPEYAFVFHAEKQGAPIQLDICQDNIVRTLELKIPRRANAPFRAMIRRGNLVLIEGSYEVEFSKVGVTRWRCLNVSATEWVALESKLGFFGEKPEDEQPIKVVQDDVQAA